MATPTELYLNISSSLRSEEERRRQLAQQQAREVQQMQAQARAQKQAEDAAREQQALDMSSADWAPEQKNAMFVGLQKDAEQAQQMQLRQTQINAAQELAKDAPATRRLAMMKSISDIAANTGQDPNELARVAGLDFKFTPENPAQGQAALGAALGLPTPPPAVDQPGLSRKLREALTLQRAKASEARIREIEDANQKMGDIAPSVERFLELNQTTPTGGLYALPGIRQAATYFSPARQEMESTTAKLVPQVGRQGLPGQASNLDVQMFRSAVVSPEKSLEANMAIGNALIAQTKRNKDFGAFLRTYSDTYGGDLRGAETAWQQYIESNPIFDPSAAQQGHVRLNQNRQDWRQFFAAQSGRQSQAGAIPAGGGGASRPPLESFIR